MIYWIELYTSQGMSQYRLKTALLVKQEYSYLMYLYSAVQIL